MGGGVEDGGAVFRVGGGYRHSGGGENFSRVILVTSGVVGVPVFHVHHFVMPPIRGGDDTRVGRIHAFAVYLTVTNHYYDTLFLLVFL